MVKTKQEMLDQAYTREVVLEIRRYAKSRQGYGLTHAFETVLIGELDVQKELTGVVEARARAIRKVEDRYQQKIQRLQGNLDGIRRARRSEVSDIMRAAASFFASWIMQEVAKTGKIDDVINSKRDLASEYTRAWIKGWRPAV